MPSRGFDARCRPLDLAADFQPRIGNSTDGRLFFVAASGDDDVDELFHIDVTPSNRSAIPSRRRVTQ